MAELQHAEFIKEKEIRPELKILQKVLKEVGLKGRVDHKKFVGLDRSMKGHNPEEELKRARKIAKEHQERKKQEEAARGIINADLGVESVAVEEVDPEVVEKEAQKIVKQREEAYAEWQEH